MWRNKMKKWKWLCAAVTAVCLSFGCAVGFAASAEGELTVGSLSVSEGSATVEGTKDGKAKVTWEGYSSIYVPVGNYNNESITVILTPASDANVGITLVNAVSPWNILYTVRADGTAAANTSLEVTATGIQNAESVSANLFIYLDRGNTEATEKTAVIEEIKVGEVSYTPAAYVEPVEPTDRLLADYTEWTGSSNVEISENDVAFSKPDGVKDGIGSVRFTDISCGMYTDGEGESQLYPVYIKIPVTGIPTGWNTLYIKFLKSSGIEKIEAYVNGIPSSAPDLDASGDGVYVCSDIEKSWNVTVSPSSPEGYSLTAVSMGNYLDGCANKHDLYLVITFGAEAVAADEYLDFAGIVWSNSAPEFATDEENLPVSIGDFENGDAVSQYTVVNHPAAEGDLPAGLVKVSYETSTSRKFIQATVANVKKSMTRLIIDYFTTSGEPVNFGVYFDSSSVQGYKLFPAGDGVIDIDLTGKIPDGAFSLRIYIDRVGQNDDAKANTVIIKSIRFTENLNMGEITQDANRFTIEETSEGTEISWPEKVGANYNVVILPITNWTKCDRFLKFTFTSEKDFILAVYEGNSNVLSPHTSYEGGVTYTIYVDMTKASVAVAEGNFDLHFYIDATGDSLANTMVLKSIEFVKEGVHSAPSANEITIDFQAETISFADNIEVFATRTESDGTFTYSDALSDGASVTPGTTLWMRTKEGDSQAASEVVAFNVPARPSVETISPTSVTDTTIVFTGEGYSFKLGDGEWTTDGCFEDLDSETEYTVKIKKNASSDAFASEEIAIKVTTKASSGGSTSDSTSESSGGNSDSASENDSTSGCGSSVSSGVLLGLFALSGVFMSKVRKNKDD